MKVSELLAFLHDLPRQTNDDPEILFDIVEREEEPTTSYGVDEAKYSHGFVTLRSVD